MSEDRSAREVNPARTVLVADDEPSMRELLGMVLKSEGHSVLTASDGQEALGLFRDHHERIDLIIQDLKMPRMDGMSLLRHLKDERVEVPVIVMTAFSTWDNAVEAMRLGAFDYLRKPFDTESLRGVVQRALETRARRGESSSGGRETWTPTCQLIGNNALIQEVQRLVKRVAPTDSTVLIQGESGTGKEIVARSIHLRSHRGLRSFVPVNCSAFTESLLESELFGHVRGAFTGAFESKQGLFRTASGGTLFLDEIADMSLTTQVKMLRVLEDRRVIPVGSSESSPVDVRIIAATNKNLENEVRARNFREDLFYRLNVIPMSLPALRERKDDIPLLAGHFLAKYARQMNKDVTRISDQVMKMLHDYDWPGNVRELENVIQREVALCESHTIENLTLASCLSREAVKVEPDTRTDVATRRLIPESGLHLGEELERIEREHLREALDRTGGNLMNAAKLLHMSYRSIRYRVKKLRVREQD